MAVFSIGPRRPPRPPLKSFYFQPPALPSNFDGHRLSPQHRPILPGSAPSRAFRVSFVRNIRMLDVILLALMVGLFGLGVAYAYACERL